MMHLPHGYRHGVWGYYWLSASEFYRCKPRHAVIFVDLAGKSWMNFPAEAMDRAKRQGVWHDKEKNYQSPTGQAHRRGLQLYPSSVFNRWIFKGLKPTGAAVVYFPGFGCRPLWTLILQL
jgi:hypothetical protein